MAYNRNILIKFLLFISAAGYILIGYFIPRVHFFLLISVYTILFLIFLFSLRESSAFRNIRLFLVAAFLFRIVLLFCTPLLSDDYLRFIWDGQLMAHGIDPFSGSPEALKVIAVQKVPLAGELYNGLNALQKSNPTCYPPFNEFFFLIPALLFPKSIFGNILIMRIFIIAAEAGTIFFGLRILRIFKKPEAGILLYALNPLIIIELTGNLHFEAVMIFFLVFGIYLWANKNPLLSSVSLGLSVSVKLITLLTIPPLIWRYKMKEKLKFLLIFSSVLFASLIPVILSPGTTGVISSVGLYFHSFEFNSGILNLIRQIALKVSGWDLVFLLGPMLAMITILIITALYFLRDNKDSLIAFETMLFSLTVYYLLTTTVHPWYVSTILIISCFTRLRYPVLWSFLVFLSYFSYRTDVVKESNVILITEYLLLYSYMAYEVFFKRGKKILSGNSKAESRESLT